ncbi:hypothetical protein BU23DRAFT_551556 [Bimuria novae-zelandiae CBS 107.79]|uniref:Secreted protein n=1 Tax=Bimuria novae-zelandiae CBS 107.79 TaxID=1447943 RepID=A0A6A5VI02_9PLEO|nr:hypothetical protein BU23DRAFT_551556 [Bimuria novae-zelandiae CBS 107.79]
MKLLVLYLLSIAWNLAIALHLVADPFVLGLSNDTSRVPRSTLTNVALRGAEIPRNPQIPPLRTSTAAARRLVYLGNKPSGRGESEAYNSW